ncbi:maltase 1-like [Ornithodoros turicata]|uniref:maltase 1-like n=1 Tax=Ornithodoros turicata TaxID=34597 RepID=UPI003139CFFF
MNSVENDNYKAPLPASDEPDGAANEKLMASGDSTKIKFTSGNSHPTADGKADLNGDAKVDIENVQAFVGLSKEELMKYATDPFWVRMRMLLFVLFWVLWVAMLVGSVIIIVLTPRCAPPPQLEWWQSAPAYTVRVDAFRDSDGDGVGDLRGLVSKLQYIKELGIGTLILSPVYQMATTPPHGPTDFRAVDSKLGSMEDFEALLNTTQEMGLHVVLELDPTFTSKEHEWFKQSRDHSETSLLYRGYYIWRYRDLSEPRNNWLTASGDSVWEYQDNRGEFVMLAWNGTYPKLNCEHDGVKYEFVDIMRFWLDKGVAGFKMNGAAYLCVNHDFMDEEEDATVASANDYDKLDHKQTKDRPETFVLLEEWREFLLNYTAKKGTDYKVLMVDDAARVTSGNASAYFGTAEKPLADLVLNRAVLTLAQPLNAHSFHAFAERTLNSTPEGKWPSYVFDSEDLPRLASRIGHGYLDAVHMFALISRATPFLLYGDELGTLDTENGQPAAMQWTADEPPATFSLPRHPDYQTLNVGAQEGNGTSHLDVLKRVASLRDKPAVRLGDTVLAVLGEDVFVMMRVRKGTPGYLLVVNFSHQETTVDLGQASSHVPESGHVEAASVGSSRHHDAKVKLAGFHLSPHEAVLIQFVPIFQ